jgi:2-polyprenyl-6-methoxyphenol hydroxylase-like FAD-dependent oxidoreductase
MPTRIGKQAVVVGAGMAGLIAARALADFFERVIVLENDALPKEATHRPGTPRSRHLHGLLAGGLQALSRQFPGFEESLSQAGAVRLRMGYDYRIGRPGYDPFPQRDLGLLVYSMTRSLLEFTVRKQLREYLNIELRESCRVQEFIPAPDDAAVAAVRCKNSEGKNETLPADLVTDASGHGGLTLVLLHALGWTVPEETSIGVDFGYVSALFDIPEEAPHDWMGVITFPDYPHNKRATLILPVEGNRWILGLAGRYDEKPAADWDGFLMYASTCGRPRSTTRSVRPSARQRSRGSASKRAVGSISSAWKSFLGRCFRSAMPSAVSIPFTAKA